MRMRRRGNIHDIDIAAAHDRLPVIVRRGNVEFLGHGLGPAGLYVTERHHLATRIALPTRNMGEAGPGARAKDRDPKFALVHFAFLLPRRRRIRPPPGTPLVEDAAANTARYSRARCATTVLRDNVAGCHKTDR